MANRTSGGENAKPNAETQVIQDEAPGGKYFHFMLNMADDDLDVYEYRLLGHYRRVCGANNFPCTETVRETAAKIKKMSPAQVSVTRRRLAELGWITIKPGKGKDVSVTLVDRMKDNVMRYAACSPHEQTPADAPACSPHEHHVHHVNAVFTRRTTCSPHERGTPYISRARKNQPVNQPEKNQPGNQPSPAESGDSARDAAVGAAADETPDPWSLVRPLIDHHLKITDPAILDELQAKGAVYALALVWDVLQRKNVLNPAGLAIHQLHNGGPAAVTLDVARIGLEQGILDFADADSYARRQEQATLIEQANAHAAQFYAPCEANGWNPLLPPGTTRDVVLDATLDECPPGQTLTWRHLWTAVLGELQLRLNRLTYESWVAGAKAVSYADGVLTVRARHNMAQFHLSQRAGEIGDSLTKLAGMPVRVVFIAGDDPVPESASEPTPDDPAPPPVARDAPEPAPPVVQEPGEAAKPASAVNPVAAEPPAPIETGLSEWESPQAFWAAVLERVKGKISATAYGWFAGSQAEGYANGFLTVRMSTAGLNGLRAPMFQREFDESLRALAGRSIFLRPIEEVCDAVGV